MTPPLSMIPATSHFQVPMPQMTGAYQQAMFGGQFHGHFPASPQFVSQGYSGGNDQGQQQPSQEAIPGNANEDEVEEVPASQVPQPQGKKKGACHRIPKSAWVLGNPELGSENTKEPFDIFPS